METAIFALVAVLQFALTITVGLLVMVFAVTHPAASQRHLALVFFGMLAAVVAVNVGITALFGYH